MSFDSLSMHALRVAVLFACTLGAMPTMSAAEGLAKPRVNVPVNTRSDATSGALTIDARITSPAPPPTAALPPHSTPGPHNREG